jgi:hypothetical protein
MSRVDLNAGSVVFLQVPLASVARTDDITSDSYRSMKNPRKKRQECPGELRTP